MLLFAMPRRRGGVWAIHKGGLSLIVSGEGIAGLVVTATYDSQTSALGW